MTIAVADDVAEFLSEQVRAGVCPDASDFVNDFLRSLRDQSQSLDFTPELETILLESASEPVTPLTNDDFAQIRAQIRLEAAKRRA